MIVQYCGKSPSSVVLQIAAAKIVPEQLGCAVVVCLLVACEREVRVKRWALTSSLLCDEMDAPACPRAEMGRAGGTAGGIILGCNQTVIC